MNSGLRCAAETVVGHEVKLRLQVKIKQRTSADFQQIKTVVIIGFKLNQLLMPSLQSSKLFLQQKLSRMYTIYINCPSQYTKVG